MGVVIMWVWSHTDLEGTGYAVPIERIVGIGIASEHALGIAGKMILVMVVQNVLIVGGFKTAEVSKQTPTFKD